MSDIRERIADTVRQHRPGASIVAYTCECGVSWTSEHVADAVIEALGLTKIMGHVWHRWATPWERIGEDG